MSHVDLKVQLQSAIGYQSASRFADAVKISKEIIAAHPNNFDATYLLAMLYAQQGAMSSAVEMFRRAVRLKPNFFDAHYNLALAMNLTDEHEGALRHYQRALKLDPSHVDAINNYAGTLSKLGRFQDSLQQYRKLLALRPDHAEGHHNMGIIMTELRRFDEALKSAESAIAIFPGYAEAHFSCGVALAGMNRPSDALSSYDKAIILKPDYAEAFSNRGVVLQELDRLDDALESYDKAIALKPDYADAHRNRYMLLLLQGDFDRGWSEMEWRKKRDSVGGRQFHEPPWLGDADITGKTLLVHWEHGLGDTIQFSRFIPLLQEMGIRVLFMPQRTLCALMSSLGGETRLVGDGGVLPDFDYHCPLMSLPLAFKTTFESIPRKVPYLSAEQDRAERWRKVVLGSDFKIGIAWQGNVLAEHSGRSVPLSQFGRLSKLPNVRLISLQKKDGSEQVGNQPTGMHVETLGDAFDAGRDAFLDTAAVMKNLDLVITIDTSIAHLAGALGIPTWVALKKVPDWRWLVDRSDSPWYPTVRLFRQKVRGDWEDVFRDIEAALIAEIASRRDSVKEAIASPEAAKDAATSP
jgi:tetratricopeptide (TPR) repeat protein